MFKAKLNFRLPLTVLLASAVCSAVVLPLVAADAPAPALPASGTHVESTQIMLIRRLAERGAITQEDAAEMIKLSEADAADARVQAALTALATAQSEAARAHAEAAAIQAKASRNGAKQDAAIAVPTVPPVVETSSVSPVPIATESTVTATPVRGAEDDTVHVTYVPEVVKAQLREEIKNDVLEQAKKEGWATPRAVPDWVSRFTLYGDFRLRYETIYNHKQNVIGGLGSNFWNYNAINTGSPYDVGANNTANPPLYNVDQDRNRLRLRARLGVVADLGDGFTSGFRIATGENGSPVSQNQSLGAAGSGQGGNFSKYSLWLDRAFLKYQSRADSDRALVLTLGRFENPFLATSVIWADDLGFDGLVLKIPAQIHYDGQIVDAVKPYFVVGAFPIFNTDLNYSSNWPDKYKSNDKWLDAAQFGIDLKLGRDLRVKLGAAYYYFTKTVGKLSSAYTPLTSADAGDTDARRPAFAQKGNTYMMLRNIVPDSTNASGYSNQWQYFGLASAFRDLTFDVRVDYNHFEPFQVSFIGEYIKNTAFDKMKIQSRGPKNNLGGATGDEFVGKGTAWITGVKLGHAQLDKRWDWNVLVNYRYVGSDAVIDGFCDSDFGGGGTNVKGTTLGLNVALSKRVSFAAKWMSSSQIEGLTYLDANSNLVVPSTVKTDILQLDINAKF